MTLVAQITNAPPMTEAAVEDQTPSKPVPAGKKDSSFTWFLVKLAIFVLILRTLIFSPFNIPSESMLPRLMIGDYLIVSKWSYGYSRFSIPFSPPIGNVRLFASTPERGDVVVFKAPPSQSQDYIKRVIGLPGDLIQVKSGQVILNGNPIPKRRAADFVEPLTPNSACAKADAARFRETASDGSERCRWPRFEETLPNGRSYFVLDTEQRTYPKTDGVNPDETGIYVVPAGHVFLMGDNRDNSADSRYPAMQGGGIGIVPEANLVGKAWFSVFSTDGTANWFLPWTWFSAARWDRIGEGF